MGIEDFIGYHSADAKHFVSAAGDACLYAAGAITLIVTLVLVVSIVIRKVRREP